MTKSIYTSRKQGKKVILMNKKAFIHHPLGMALIAFFLGLLVMYLIAKEIIPLPIKVC